MGVRRADDLSDLEATTREEGRRRSWPVFASALQILAEDENSGVAETARRGLEELTKAKGKS